MGVSRCSDEQIDVTAVTAAVSIPFTGKRRRSRIVEYLISFESKMRTESNVNGEATRNIFLEHVKKLYLTPLSEDGKAFVNWIKPSENQILNCYI